MERKGTRPGPDEGFREGYVSAYPPLVSRINRFLEGTKFPLRVWRFNTNDRPLRREGLTTRSGAEKIARELNRKLVAGEL